MTNSETPCDELDEEIGITFGLGIDIDAHYECFLLYSLAGGHEEDGLLARDVSPDRFDVSLLDWQRFQ